MKRVHENQGTHTESSKEVTFAKQKFDYENKELMVYGRKNKTLHPP